MKQLSEKLEEVISTETKKASADKKIKETEQFIADMKKAGLIKQSNYNLPLVDTIGKTYYSSTNKRS